MRTKLRSLPTDCEGSALVEGALIIPVLFVLLYGVYEFSFFFYQQQLVATGLHDAARYLARLPGSCDPASTDRPIDQARARNLATTGSIVGGIPRVRGWTADLVAVDCAAVANPVAENGLKLYRGGPLIYVVTVSTRLAENSLGFFSFTHVAAPALSGTHSERVTGPG
jgi:Flp pilus assembly protein TadG